MNYALHWGEYWSTKYPSFDDRVIVRYTQEDDGWWRHDFSLYFIAKSDDEARKYIKKFMRNYGEPIGVYSLENRDSHTVIATEEDEEE
jgi:hypothetical protein